MIRRFCDGNNSASSIEKAVENSLIYKIIQNSKISGLDLQPGHSDSGARLSKEIKEIPLNIFMWKSLEMHKKVGFMLNSHFDQRIYESVEGIIDETKDDPLKYILYSYTDKEKSYNSTTCLRYNSTSGFTSLKPIVSGNTI